jgi:alcohol dehydrogenase
MRGADVREVWRMPRAGSLDRLVREAESLSEPGPGEARVAVKAIGLNFADVFACLGLYSATPTGPFVPGLECAGVVEAVGEATAGSAAWAPGDRVIGLTRFGAYATALTLDSRYLLPIPAGWSFAEAAALPVQGLTAWYGLVELGRLSPDAVVLLHSAAGGVGLNGLGILAGYRARVVATVGRESKRDYLVARHGLAPDQVIVRDRRGFSAQLDRALAAVGAEGFDLIFDAIAGPYFQPAYDRLRPEGRYVMYGAADFMPPGSRPNYLSLAARYLARPRLDPLKMIAQNRSLLAFNLIWLWDRVERLAEGYAKLRQTVQVPPLIGRRFPFAEAPAALKYLQGGESVGKVVLEV